jgi:hypothetical protein
MADRGVGDEQLYRRGYREALGMVMRGILGIEAEQLDIGELIASLSRYEEEVDAWFGAGDGVAPPTWQPTADEVGADEGEGQ